MLTAPIWNAATFLSKCLAAAMPGLIPGRTPRSSKQAILYKFWNSDRVFASHVPKKLPCGSATFPLSNTIFVTGGAGFIGSAVIRRLLDHTGARVVNIDKLTYAANLASIPQAPAHPRYVFAKVDICNGAELRAL